MQNSSAMAFQFVDSYMDARRINSVTLIKLQPCKELQLSYFMEQNRWYSFLQETFEQQHGIFLSGKSLFEKFNVRVTYNFVLGFGLGTALKCSPGHSFFFSKFATPWHLQGGNIQTE